MLKWINDKWINEQRLKFKLNKPQPEPKYIEQFQA